MAELTGTTCYVGGMLDKRAGVLQPLSYVRGLARAAKKVGAAIHRSVVTRLEAQEGHWRAIAPKGSVTAGKVILATNAYTPLPMPSQPRPARHGLRSAGTFRRHMLKRHIESTQLEDP